MHRQIRQRLLFADGIRYVQVVFSRVPAKIKWIRARKNKSDIKEQRMLAKQACARVIPLFTVIYFKKGCNLANNEDPKPAAHLECAAELGIHCSYMRTSGFLTLGLKHILSRLISNKQSLTDGQCCLILEMVPTESCLLLQS